MLFQGLLASTLLLVGGVQASSFEGSAKRTAEQGMVTVHKVDVGKDGKLAYWPEKLTVAPGEMVQFTFFPKNHTVTQSDFDHPCVPISQITPNVTGIRSGFMPVAAGDANQPVFTIVVNDTKPIWLYCGQTGHCQKGMAMVINENTASGKTLEAYKDNAANGAPAPSSGGASPTAVPPYGTTGLGGSPTTSGPALATTNAAPKQVANAAGFTGLLIAALAFMGL